MKRAWALLLACGVCLAASDRVPMTAKFEDSASFRWLSKKVLRSRVLDDCGSLAHWKAFTTGGIPLVDARVDLKATDAERAVSEMSVTAEGSRDGGPVLRVRVPARLPVPGPKSGRAWGGAGVRRLFGGEDWRRFNRVSFWVRPEGPGFFVTALELRLYNEGVEKLPAPFGQEGETTVVLRNHEWNRVVWEIGNVARDKVASLEFHYLISGGEPEAGTAVVFDFDDLELEAVEPDYVEGWGVWPGRVAYSHTGYSNGGVKTALASGLAAREFRLVDQETGETVLAKPVRTVSTRLGGFQVMDFSEVRRTGSYVLEAGGPATRPFRIEPDVWRGTVLKALNFLYAERCGAAIPGIHSVCHRDWTVEHDGKRIVINGGWHDAGDLTQDLFNTTEIVRGLFRMAERLSARGDDPELLARVLEEARWGLDWVLKTRFGDGFRNGGSAISRKTNGIIGDDDDVTATARNTADVNFAAASVEALAGRILKGIDPRTAAYALRAAAEDWRFALDRLGAPPASGAKEIWRGNFDSANVELETVSAGALASVELWRATADPKYADKASELGKAILDSQERTRPDWDIPLLGFFYTGPAKDRVLHYCHKGHEHMPVVALTALCEALPGHPDWMKWYSAVVLHSQYQMTVAEHTEPYGVLPASIYRDDEYLTVPESRRESFRKQVLQGVPLGKGRYLRLFPVWLDYRGHFGTILSQAQALEESARLRGDLEAARLAERQLEWVIGRNPFSQSTMWGEGYDFPPLYSPSSGDMVGGLPVGIQTRGESDVPYWPVQSTWTYKEIWVYPAARWLELTRDLGARAIVEGRAGAVVELEDKASGQKTVAEPDPVTGRFRATVPEGTYVVRSLGAAETRTFLPGGAYEMDLRPGRALDFEVAKSVTAGGDVTIKLIARGSGAHRFALRTDNLTLSDPEKELTLEPGREGTLEWRARVVSNDTPWVAVIYPDDDLSRRKEIGDTIPISE